MITISRSMSVSGMTNYAFGKENGKDATLTDYYISKDCETIGINPTLHGRLAAELGISGPASRETFEALVAGIDPTTGERLVQTQQGTKANGEQGRERRGGQDIQFAPSKSVSIAIAAGAVDRDLMDSATQGTMRYIEDNLLFVRETKGGITRNVQADAGVWTTLQHSTNRNLDPQAHDHNFTLNISRSGDKYRAVNMDPIFREQKNLGVIHQQYIASGLQERGIDIEIRDRAGNYNVEIAQIPREQCDALSSRRAEILAQAAEWEKSGTLDTNRAAVLQRAALYTRAAKGHLSIAETHAAVLDSIRDVGINPDSLATQIARPAEKQLETPMSINEALHRAAGTLGENENTFSKTALIAQAIKIGGPGLGSPDKIFAELDQAIEKKEFLRLGGLFIDNRGNYIEQFTTPDIATRERAILDRTIAERGNFAGSALSTEKAYRLINEFNKTMRSEKGFQLTDGQREAVGLMLAGRDGIAQIIGDAGTGKTAALDAVRQINDKLQSQGEKGFNIVVVGFTARAAEEAAAKIGESRARTIDSATSHKVTLGVDTQFEKGSLQLRNAPVLLVVDESSMLSDKHIERLVAYGDKIKGTTGQDVKFVLQGDTKQILAIGGGNAYKTIAGLDIDRARLAEVVRTKEGSLGHTVATNLAAWTPEGNKAALDAMRKAGAIVSNRDLAELDKEAVSRITAEFQAGRKDSVIATLTNEDRGRLNTAVREEFKSQGLLSAETRTIETMVPARLSASAQLDARSITVDDAEKIMVVKYAGERVAIPAGAIGRPVEHIDENSLRVVYETTDKSGKTRTVEAIHDMSREGQDLRAYEIKPLEIAVGDRLAALENDRKGSGLLNGNNVEIIGFGEKDGEFKVKLGNDTEKTLNLGRDTAGYAALEHGFASTLHKLQGASLEGETIAFLKVRPGLDLSLADLSSILGDKTVSPDVLAAWRQTVTAPERDFARTGAIVSNKRTFKPDISIGIVDISKDQDSSDLAKVLIADFGESGKNFARGDGEIARQALRAAGAWFDPEHQVWLASVDNLQAAELLGVKAELKEAVKAGFAEVEKDPAAKKEIAPAAPNLAAPGVGEEIAQGREQYAEASRNLVYVAGSRGERLSMLVPDEIGLERALSMESAKRTTIDETLSTVKRDGHSREQTPKAGSKINLGDDHSFAWQSQPWQVSQSIPEDRERLSDRQERLELLRELDSHLDTRPMSGGMVVVDGQSIERLQSGDRIIDGPWLGSQVKSIDSLALPGYQSEKMTLERHNGDIVTIERSRLSVAGLATRETYLEQVLTPENEILAQVKAVGNSIAGLSWGERTLESFAGGEKTTWSGKLENGEIKVQPDGLTVEKWGEPISSEIRQPGAQAAAELNNSVAGSPQAPDLPSPVRVEIEGAELEAGSRAIGEQQLADSVADLTSQASEHVKEELAELRAAAEEKSLEKEQSKEQEQGLAVDETAAQKSASLNRLLDQLDQSIEREQGLEHDTGRGLDLGPGF